MTGLSLRCFTVRPNWPELSSNFRGACSELTHSKCCRLPKFSQSTAQGCYRGSPWVNRISLVKSGTDLTPVCWVSVIGGDHAMLKTEEAIRRCKCGRELTNLRSFPDAQTGTRFLTQRCEACGEVSIILFEEKGAASE